MDREAWRGLKRSGLKLWRSPRCFKQKRNKGNLTGLSLAQAKMRYLISMLTGWRIWQRRPSTWARILDRRSGGLKTNSKNNHGQISFSSPMGSATSRTIEKPTSFRQSVVQEQNATAF